MPLAKLEQTTEQKVARWCRARGILCLKGKPSGLKGWPDRTIILPHGRILFIEFKRPNGKLDAIQANSYDLLKTLGHEVYVCTDADATCEIIFKAYNR